MTLTRTEKEHLFQIVLPEHWAGKQFEDKKDRYNPRTMVLFEVDDLDCDRINKHRNMDLRPGHVLFHAPRNSRTLRSYHTAGTNLLDFLLALM